MTICQSPAVPEYYESEMTWKFHLLLKGSLEHYGIAVKTTRVTKDTLLGVYERGAASEGCDLFLSIHSNAAGSNVNEDADRVMVYVPLDGSGDEIGQMFVDRISLIMGTQQQGRTTNREGSNRDYCRVTPVEADVLYRVQACAFRIRANADAYLAEVKAAGLDAYITAQAIKETSVEPESYTLNQLIQDVQTAVGAAVDGMVGPETLSKVPTISQLVNRTHPAVIPIQKRLHALGYVQVGKADGIAGSGFERAVKAFQTDNNSEVDGEVTAGGRHGVSCSC